VLNRHDDEVVVYKPGAVQCESAGARATGHDVAALEVEEHLDVMTRRLDATHDLRRRTALHPRTDRTAAVSGRFVDRPTRRV